MTKRDLVIRVAAKLGLTQNEVASIVQESLDTITATLVEGHRLEIRNFGVFEIKERDARIGRNPRTGEKVPIAQKKVASFRPGKTLKEWVQVGPNHRPEHLFRDGDGSPPEGSAATGGSPGAPASSQSPEVQGDGPSATPSAPSDEKQTLF